MCCSRGADLCIVNGCFNIARGDQEPAEVDFLVSILFNDDNVPTLSSTMNLAKRTYQKRKLCHIPNCHSYVQSRNRGKRHGGGKRCRSPQCIKAPKNIGLCHVHGDGLVCQVFGCKKTTQKRGFCATHGGVDQCVVNGCCNTARGGQRCSRHALTLRLLPKYRSAMVPELAAF